MMLQGPNIPTPLFEILSTTLPTLQKGEDRPNTEAALVGDSWMTINM